MTEVNEFNERERVRALPVVEGVDNSAREVPDGDGALESIENRLTQLASELAPTDSVTTNYGGEDCLIVKDRPDYQQGKPLPDITFPVKFLSQGELKGSELQKAADWFVYKIGEDGEIVKDESGQPQFNDFFKHIKSMTNEKNFFLVNALTRVARSKTVKSLMNKLNIHFPYYESESMIEIAKIAFASSIKPEFGTDGSQYFYQVIAPVYEFFHQMNTQAVQDFKDGDFKQIGSLPFSLINKSAYSNETGYYPNDAIGRDLISTEIAKEAPNGSRILAVGDGPALTSVKLAQKFIEEGKKNVTITILEYNQGQIENGRRYFGGLTEDIKTKLQESQIKIEWIQGDASNMSQFANETYDFVFSTYVVGAMGGKEMGQTIVSGYAKEASRVLKPGGKHVALDFYLDGDDIKDGYRKEKMSQAQEKVRKAYRLMKGLIDGPLKSCYEGIWDHLTKLNDVLIKSSREGNLQWERSHRQTWFGHLPLFRIGSKVLALSVPGYNEITNRFTKKIKPQ